MFIQIILTIWLLALIFLTNKFRREEKINQQRIFSIFLIIWACLSVVYYDVWTFTSGTLEQTHNQWQTYLPAAFFSICAGLGTYYLLMTFGKFRTMNHKNQRQADQKRTAKSPSQKNPAIQKAKNKQRKKNHPNFK